MHKLIGFLVPTAVLLLAVAAVAAQNGAADVIGGDETTVRELLSRTQAAYPAYEGVETTIQVGSLPVDLPFELTLADDMRVIGTIQRGAAFATEIYIDAAQAPETTIAFFADTFAGEDWQIVDNFPGGGFISTPSDSAFYCNDSLNTLVSLNAFEYGESMSDLRLYVMPGGNSPCSDAETSRTPDPYRLLPQLQTPEGVTLLQRGGGGGGGSNGFQSASTQAYLKSDLPLADIAAAYNQQLADLGWQSVGEESGEKLSWSGWTMEGEDKTWAGILTLTASPTAPTEYSAVLSIQETAAAS